MCTMYGVRCTVCGVYGVYGVRCTMCTVYGVRCTMYDVYDVRCVSPARPEVYEGIVQSSVSFKATVPVLDEFAVRYSLFATAAGCLGLPASNRVQP